MQLTHPVSDVTTSGWSKTPSGAPSFAAALQEYPNPDDANFVTSPTDPVLSVFEVQLSPSAWPKVLEDGHKLRVRMRKTDSGGLAVGVYLMQGIVPIAYRAPTLTTSLTTFEMTLTDEEVALITDYSDLRVRVVAG